MSCHHRRSSHGDPHGDYVPFPDLSGCPELGVGLLGVDFGVVFFFFNNFSAAYKTVIIHLHLLPHCSRLRSCPPMSHAEAQGEKKKRVLAQPCVRCLI